VCKCFFLDQNKTGVIRLFIQNMIRMGYPAEKLLFYRDGLQGWKLLGLTTVIHQKHQVQ